MSLAQGLRATARDQGGEKLTRDDVTRLWNATVDQWMLDCVPYRYQGSDPATGLDCFQGVVIGLYRIAGIDLPDYVHDEQVRQGQRNIGHGITEQYRDLFCRVESKPAQVGDVATFVFPHDTHAGVMLDQCIVAHAMETVGVCRSRLASLRRRSVGFQLLRYHGPGADVFQA